MAGKGARLAEQERQGRGGVLALLEAMRFEHWAKNVFVLAALAFSRKWAYAEAWVLAGLMFLAFCLISSSVYIVNDIADRRSDRAHPHKRHRPIASGRLELPIALSAAGVLALLAVILVAQNILLLRRSEYVPYPHQLPLGGYAPALWLVLYLGLNLAYSFAFKRVPILDVLMVAVGFVLRAMAGAAAIAVPASPWLVLCTFTLCLFIALAKRRSELLQLGEQAVVARPAHRFYTPTNLEHMLTVSAALAVISYSLYSLDARTFGAERPASVHLIWTIPLVVYGMFRYYCLTLTCGTDDAVRLMLRDRVLWLVGAAWLTLVLAIQAWGAHPQLRGLLLQ